MFGGMGGVSYTAGSAYDIVVGIGGPLNVQAGSGGGQSWGGGVLRAGSGQAVLFGSNGDQLHPAGGAGHSLVAGAGDVLLDGSKATGSDAFFGGTGRDTIIAGSGDVLIGTGTSTVRLGQGRGVHVRHEHGHGRVGQRRRGDGRVGGARHGGQRGGGTTRSFALFNFVPSTDRISLAGYGNGTAANALAP